MTKFIMIVLALLLTTSAAFAETAVRGRTDFRFEQSRAQYATTVAELQATIAELQTVIDNKKLNSNTAIVDAIKKTAAATQTAIQTLLDSMVTEQALIGN